MLSTYICLLLALLLAFVSFGALVGGGAMMLGAVYPEMDTMKMSLSLLDSIPFITSWFIPGLLLFLLNGIGNGWAACVCFRKDYMVAGKTGLMMGSVLFVWILVQVIVIGYVNILQPIFGIIGMMEIMIAIFLLKIEKALNH